MEQKASRLEDFTPVLADSITIHNVDENKFVLRDGEQGNYIALSYNEAVLARLIDGKRSAEDIFITSYELENKVPIAALLSLLRKLGSAGVLANTMEEIEAFGLMGDENYSLYHTSLWSRLTSWGIYIDGSSSFVQAVTNPLVAPFLIVIAAFYGVLGFVVRSDRVMSGLSIGNTDYFGALLIVVIAFSLTLSFRELVKGSVLSAGGGRVWRFGLAFYFFIPYFATDRRDRIICTKRGRALLALSGLTSCLVLIILGVTLQERATGLVPLFGFMLTIISSIVLFLNMSPIFGGDFNKLISALSEGDIWHRRAYSYMKINSL